MLKNKITFSGKTRLGIVGGGQLAQMIGLQAQSLGYDVLVLSQNKFDPGAKACSHWIQGSDQTSSDVKKLLTSCDLLTFESEFVNFEVIKKALKSCRKKPVVFPPIESIAQLSDRLSQKKLLQSFKIPTSDFIEINSIENEKNAQDKFPQGFVVKKRSFGYDGKGTLIVTKTKILTQKLKKEFFTNSIAEQFIPFKRELAFMIGRTVGGDIFSLPLVESYQQNSRCLWVKGPIHHPKLLPLKKKIHRFLESMHYVGIMGVELFETKEGELIVNEIAPRVHNSGHYSQNSHSLSQFSLHILAASHIKLQPYIQTPYKGFAMYNIIGDGKTFPLIKASKNCHLHWYNKDLNKEGRKMGHINAIASNPEQALKDCKKYYQEVMKNV